jgi:linoleoyl-CoA desaturase
MTSEIRFNPPNKSLFFPTLKKRVDEYFINNNISRHANATMVIKTIVLLAGYITPFVLILTLNLPFHIALIMWVVMGISFSDVGMCVMHDANHKAYSSSDKINKLLGNTLTLIGGSVSNWKMQHNVLHHTFTNIVDADDDIADKLVLRFSPHTPVKWFHKFQWIYAFFFYGLQTVYWVFFKDYIQHSKYSAVEGESKAYTLVKLLSIKFAYYFVFLVMPTLFFNVPLNEVLIGFFLMHFVGGIILTTTFQLAHTVEKTSHPLPNEKNMIENDWAIHQMNTTVNFAPQNKLISWYIGGLNFQVEHHLFPRICHVHHPEISKIVKQTAAEFDIPYLENETIAEAFMSHVNTLKRFGKPEPSLATA